MPGLACPPLGPNTRAGNTAPYCLPSCAVSLRSHCLGCPSDEHLSRQLHQSPSVSCPGDLPPLMGCSPKDTLHCPLSSLGVTLCLHASACSECCAPTRAALAATQSRSIRLVHVAFPRTAYLCNCWEAFLLTKLPPSCLDLNSEQESPSKMLRLPCVHLRFSAAQINF